MPAFIRGYVVCDGCGKTATATASVSTRHDFELWWDLPEGWKLFGRGKNKTSVYCSNSCNKHLAVLGYPDQEGRRKEDPSAFDARTLDAIYAMIEQGASGASADNVIAAIEAVLMAWRQKGATAS